MAGDAKPTPVVEADADVYVNYKVEILRQEKIVAAGKERLDDIKLQQRELYDRQREAKGYADRADLELAEVNESFLLQSNRVKSLQREHELLGKELEAAEKAGDLERVEELNARYSSEIAELESEQQLLRDYDQQKGPAQAEAAARRQDLAVLQEVSNELTWQEEKLGAVLFHATTTIEHSREAAVYQDVANTAAGGDPVETRRAVLAVAEAAAEKYQEAAPQQAKTFQDMRAAESTLKALKDEQEISSREQARLQRQVAEAERAGKTDAAASLQKDLEWRTARTNELATSVSDKDSEVAGLRESHSYATEQLATLKKESEDLRKLADAPPEEIERVFKDRENATVAAAKKSEEARSDDADRVLKELEAEVAAQETPTPAEPAQPDAEAEVPADPAELDELAPLPTADTAAALDDSTETLADAPVIVDEEMLTPVASEPLVVEHTEPTVSEIEPEPEVEPQPELELELELQPEPEPEPELEPEPEPEPEIDEQYEPAN